MNTRQKRVVAMGLAVIVALGFYPPWLYGIDGQGGGEFPFRAEVPAGYHWVFSPPPLPSSDDCFSVTPPALGSGLCVRLKKVGYARRDYARLLVHWLMVLLVGGGMVLLFAERRSSPCEKDE